MYGIASPFREYLIKTEEAMRRFNYNSYDETGSFRECRKKKSRIISLSTGTAKRWNEVASGEQSEPLDNRPNARSSGGARHIPRILFRPFRARSFSLTHQRFTLRPHHWLRRIFDARIRALARPILPSKATPLLRAGFRK